jgi:hypothetical protein
LLTRFACTLAFLLSLLLVSPVPAADLFLSDEPEVYAAIDKLNTLGYLPGLLANTRPYSLQAVRAAIELPRAPEGFDGELFRWLAGYVSAKQMGRITGAVAHSDSRFTPGNNDGIPVPKGWSGYASIAGREETTPLVNGQVRFSSFYGEGGDNGNRVLDASLEVGYPWLAIQAGKLSGWYGPGRHGALILTNNAAPYTGVRLHNPQPIPTQGRLPFLGSFQYDLFGARMSKKEQFSHSLLAGTRFAARPGRLLEVGFSRTVHYDGEGRSKGISEFSKAYFGNNEASGESDSLTGFDISLILPIAAQPVQVFWERAVDDNSRLGRMFVPWSDVGANIFGIYLPRVPGSSRVDLRVEYADTYSGEAKYENWYEGPSYPHQYRGNFLGHPMGGSARDWFVESRYFLRPDAVAGISYEALEHEGGDLAGENRSIVSAGLAGWFSKYWRGEVRASWEYVSDEEGIPGRDGSDVFVYVGLSWQTDALVAPDEEEVPIREIQGVPR